MHIIFIYAGLFISSVVYAWLLSTQAGKRWADELTWATVTAGVGLAVAWLAVDNPAVAQKVLAFASVAGVPFVFRSLYLQLRRTERVYRREMER